MIDRPRTRRASLIGAFPPPLRMPSTDSNAPSALKMYIYRSGVHAQLVSSRAVRSNTCKRLMTAHPFRVPPVTPRTCHTFLIARLASHDFCLPRTLGLARRRSVLRSQLRVFHQPAAQDPPYLVHVASYPHHSTVNTKLFHACNRISTSLRPSARSSTTTAQSLSDR